jgi:hypothetical protein
VVIEMKVNNIDVSTNLVKMFEMVSSNFYKVSDTGIDAYIEIKEDKKLKVTGKGAKTMNAYIKGCFEEYTKEILTINNLASLVDSVFSNITACGKVELNNVQIGRENGQYKVFAVVSLFDAEYGYNRKVGYVEFNENMEIIEYKQNKNEELATLMNRFIEAYNKYTGVSNNKEIINNEVSSSVETENNMPEVKEIYYIVANRVFNNIDDAKQYCDSSDFDYNMIESSDGSSVPSLNSKIDNIKNELDNIENDIVNLESEYKTIQDIRVNKGYSKAIYVCNDNEAIQLQQIDKHIKELEIKEDTLRDELKELRLQIHKYNCLESQYKFNDCRYQIIYDNDTTNKLYTNDYNNYIVKAIQDNKDISVFEYIDYNNNINKAVNMPVLKCIYKYVSQYQYTYNCIPHQDGYSSYKEVWTDNKGNILQLIERGYNNSNIELYHRMINIFGTECIWVYNNSIENTITIDRYKHSDAKKSNIDIKYRIKKDRSKHDIDRDIKDIITNALNSVSKNKNYNYDVEHIRTFMLD